MQNLSDLSRLLNHEYEITEIEAWEQDNIGASGVCEYKFDVDSTIVKIVVAIDIDHEPGNVTQKATATIEPHNQKVFDAVKRFFHPLEGDNNLIAERKRKPFELIINNTKV